MASSTFAAQERPESRIERQRIDRRQRCGSAGVGAAAGGGAAADDRRRRRGGGRRSRARAAPVAGGLALAARPARKRERLRRFRRLTHASRRSRSRTNAPSLNGSLRFTSSWAPACSARRRTAASHARIGRGHRHRVDALAAVHEAARLVVAHGHDERLRRRLHALVLAQRHITNTTRRSERQVEEIALRLGRMQLDSTSARSARACARARRRCTRGPRRPRPPLGPSGDDRGGLPLLAGPAIVERDALHRRRRRKNTQAAWLSLANAAAMRQGAPIIHRALSAATSATMIRQRDGHNHSA